MGESPRQFTPDEIARLKGHLIVCAECTAGDYCDEGLALGVDDQPWLRPFVLRSASALPSDSEEAAGPTLDWHREIDRLHHLVDLAANHTAYSYVHSDAVRAREFLARLRSSPSVPESAADDAALARLAERIDRQAKSVPLGAAFVGGPLAGASIYNVYKFAATVVDDARKALRAALSGGVPTEETER